MGTVQLGMDYGIQNNGRPDSKETDKILTAALEKGVCWFDTAPVYGKAEIVLGRYILEHPEQAERMRIVSKLPSNAFSGLSCREWRGAALAHIQKTLERLQKQRLDVYMLHNASSIFEPAVVEALEAVRREGLAETIGVSIYTPAEAMKALSYPQIGAVQIPYNVFDHRLDQCGFFVEAQKRNVRVFARSSLLQGLLIMDPEQLPEHMGFAMPYITKFRSICRQASVSPLQLAIRFVASHPGIHYLVFGADNQKQLLEYLSIEPAPLPEKVMEELNSEFYVVEERLVNPSLWSR